MNSSGVCVVPHRSLAGYNGSWIFERKDRLIVSVPPDYVDLVSGKLTSIDIKAETLQDYAWLSNLFESDIEKSIGPVYQGFFDAPQAPQRVHPEIKQMDYERDIAAIDRLARGDDPTGWTNSGINQHSAYIVGYQREDQTVAMAGYKMVSPTVAFIGVYTDTRHRGHGYGKEVVRAALHHIVACGFVARYQTLMSNSASKGIAEKIGFRAYANHLAVRFN